MDPFVIFIITLLALGGGGASSAVWVNARARRRRALGRALLDKAEHAGQMLSIFDVFWDLGVSDYALVLMAHQGLLPQEADAFKQVHFHLDDLIEAHGSYSDFIADNLEAIEEFYRDHQETGSRRKIALLRAGAQKLLPLSAGPGGGESGGSEASATTQLMRRESAGRDQGLAYADGVGAPSLLSRTVQPDLPTLGPAPGRVEIDIDEASRLKPGQMLKNIFDGRWRDELDKWWKFRHLRAAKSRLDEALQRFYDFYATDASRRPGYFDALYDIPRRWHLEAERIERLRVEARWREAGQTAESSRILVEEAEALARELSARTRGNVDQTIERIHGAARADNRPMAGYILYMNRHAFFAGRVPEYGAYADRIERLVYRVQQELRKLRRDGEL